MAEGEWTIGQDRVFPPESTPRKPTVKEAEAILTLVRGGWLKLELTLDESLPADTP